MHSTCMYMCIDFYSAMVGICIVISEGGQRTSEALSLIDDQSSVDNTKCRTSKAFHCSS